MKNTDPQRQLAREVVTKCKCNKSGRKFGLVIIQNPNGSWTVKHSYAVSDSYVEREDTGQVINGSMFLSDGYNGCKYCQSKSIIQCGNCHVLNCGGSTDIELNEVFSCVNCGNRGVIGGAISSIAACRE